MESAWQRVASLPAGVDVILADGAAEESFASIAGSGAVVFARRSVTADRTESSDGVVVVVTVAVVVVVGAGGGAAAGSVAIADVAAGRTGTGAG